MSILYQGVAIFDTHPVIETALSVKLSNLLDGIGPAVRGESEMTP